MQQVLAYVFCASFAYLSIIVFLHCLFSFFQQHAHSTCIAYDFLWFLRAFACFICLSSIFIYFSSLFLFFPFFLPSFITLKHVLYTYKHIYTRIYIRTYISNTYLHTSTDIIYIYIYIRLTSTYIIYA